ncbi:MAG: zinc-ribbon domain-containing protein [Candidatus Lokiarchaeota archaeon]|nr:zinc-ribbon domain-containing protein [Candidatus Lokiarchaeota archaeon]
MSNVNVNNEFSEFGKKMKIVGIMTILVIIPFAGSFLSFIGFIFGLMALGDIRNANNKLNQASLENYRSKFIIAVIFRMIGSVVSLVGSFYSFSNMLDFNYLYDFPALIMSFIPMFIGFVINLIAGALEMDAWRSLTDFFNQHRNLFPTYVANEASEGSEKLRTAALMNILSFLIITILIGWILQIIGYFKLAKLEETTGYTASATTPLTPRVQPTSPSAPSTLGANFCSNCGAKLTGQEKYCPECGSTLN